VIGNIFLTSLTVALMAILIIWLLPDSDKLPLPFVIAVLGAFVASVGAFFVSAIFLIWAN